MSCLRRLAMLLPFAALLLLSAAQRQLRETRPPKAGGASSSTLFDERLARAKDESHAESAQGARPRGEGLAQVYGDDAEDEQEEQQEQQEEQDEEVLWADEDEEQFVQYLRATTMQEAAKEDRQETPKPGTREYHRQWRQQNKAKVQERKKAYYQQNKAKYVAMAAERRQTPGFQAKMAEYYQQNKAYYQQRRQTDEFKAKNKAYMDLYYQQNKAKVKAYYQQRRQTPEFQAKMAENKAEMAKYQREYSQQNKAKLQEYHQEYYQQNKGRKHYWNRGRSDKKAADIFKITKTIAKQKDRLKSVDPFRRFFEGEEG